MLLIMQSLVLSRLMLAASPEPIVPEAGQSSKFLRRDLVKYLVPVNVLYCWHRADHCVGFHLH